MADTITPTITATEHIQNFIRGIELRDVKLVEESLKAKVSPNTQIGGSFNPLFYLLATSYERSSPDVQNAATAEEYAANTTKLIDLLFENGAKASEKGREGTGNRTLMDSVLLSDNYFDASTVLLHAIKETLAEKRPIYKPDVRATVEAIVSEAAHEARRQPDAFVNVEGSARNVINLLERLHDVVRTRLLNPTTELEKEIVGKYGSDVAHYTAPFARPEPAKIAQEVIENADDSLRQTFKRESGRASGELDKYLFVIDKRDPNAVLSDLESDLVGMEAQKKAAWKLVSGRMFREAATGAGFGEGPKKNYSEAIMGPDGIGKSTLARRKAELLVSLGLAGSTYVEFTKDNSAGPSINLPPEALARIFAKADIINIEIPEIDYNPRNPMADFGLRLIAALKASMEERKDQPVIFITGLPRVLEDVFQTNSTLESLIQKYTRLDDMTPETLIKVFDHKAAAERYTVTKEARELVVKAIEEIKNELGKDFSNGRGIKRLVDAFEDQLGDRHFGPGSTGTPGPAELKKVLPEDIRALDTYALLAGPALAKRQPAGFNAKIRFNA